MKHKQFQKLLVKNKIDLAIFTNLSEHPNPHLQYFAQYKGYGALIIPKNKPPFLIVPEMEYERAKRAKIKVIKWPKGKTFSEFLKKKVRKPKTIGIDESITSVLWLKRLKKQLKARYKDIKPLTDGLRQIKTKEEIQLYQKAVKLTDKILQKCINNIKKCKTEQDVALFLELETKKCGHELSFPTIVASGKGGAQPHYEPQNTLRKGFCVIDFGIKYKNYCTDITRTIYLGKPSKKEVEDYNDVLKANVETIKQLKPKQKCSFIENYARKVLGKKQSLCTHALGHGLGIEIHESPGFRETSEEILQPNMIVTIEPGIYRKNKYGIRIEDDILITKNGHKVLTKTSKKLRVIK